MGLNCGASLIKCILFIFNLICAIGGIALVAVGGIALKKIGDVKDVFENSDHPGIYSAFIIALGALVFVVAFFGCMGSLRESQCLLNLYALCLLTVIVLQVLLAIFVFVYNTDIQIAAVKGWDRLWIGKENPLNTQTINQIQKTIECCGSSAPHDYGTTFPKSCCPQTADICTTQLTFKIGCKQQIKETIENSSSLIAYMSIAMAVFELIAVVFSCCLSSNIRNSSR
ncbi:23 kDa integral membrane protein-like isoform X2 [Chironomus tepperi]